jgi:hypothetical protein
VSGRSPSVAKYSDPDLQAGLEVNVCLNVICTYISNVGTL